MLETAIASVPRPRYLDDEEGETKSLPTRLAIENLSCDFSGGNVSKRNAPTSWVVLHSFCFLALVLLFFASLALPPSPRLLSPLRRNAVFLYRIPCSESSLSRHRILRSHSIVHLSFPLSHCRSNCFTGQGSLCIRPPLPKEAPQRTAEGLFFTEEDNTRPIQACERDAFSVGRFIVHLIPILRLPWLSFVYEGVMEGSALVSSYLLLSNTISCKSVQLRWSEFMANMPPN